MLIHIWYLHVKFSGVASVKYDMVCLANLGVLPRYYFSRAPFPLSPVSKGDPMGAVRFSFENQKPRFKIFFACGALFRGCYPTRFRPHYI